MKKAAILSFIFCMTTIVVDATAQCTPSCVTESYYDSQGYCVGYGDSNCTVSTGRIPQGQVCCSGSSCRQGDKE